MMIKYCKRCLEEYDSGNEFNLYCSSKCKSRDRFIEITYGGKSFNLWKENFERFPEFYLGIKVYKDRFKNKCLICETEFFAFRKCCTEKCSLELKKNKTFLSTGGYHNLANGSKSRSNMEKKLMEDYGISNIFQRDDVKDKLKEKWNSIYGFDNPSKSELIKIKKRITSEKNGFWTPLDSWDDRKIYENNVHSITWAQMRKFADLKFGSDIWERIKSSRNLPQKKWLTVDHKLSRHEGYLKKINPFIIGHICNLDILEFQENRFKWSNSSITLEKLTDEINEFENKIK